MKRIDIRPFRQARYTLRLFGLKRKMPLYPVNKGLWIAGNEHLSFGCDVEFTRRAAKELYQRLQKFRPQCLLTAEAKATALAYEIAKKMGHEEYAIARKRLKEKIKGHLRAPARSITGGIRGALVLSSWYKRMIAGKRIAIIDDCISTGSTTSALLRLAEKSKARVVAVATVWLEGPWAFKRFAREISSGKLIYLDVLPVFAAGKTYDALLEQKSRIEKIVAR